MKLLKTTIIVILAITTLSFAAGVELTGVGARAMGLGGNYRAIANDWSGMYWNAAGTVFGPEGLSMGVGYEMVTPEATFMPANNMANQPFSAAYQFERENEPQTFHVPSFGIVYNTGKMAFGLGVWAPFGLGMKWDLLRTKSSSNLGGSPFAGDEYNAAYPKYEWDSNLQIVDIHPSIAYKISDNLSVGVGASILIAAIEIQQPNFTPNPFLFNPVLVAGLQAAGVSSFIKTGAPFDHLITNTMLEGDGMGYGANFGITYKPTEDLTIGVSGQYFMDIALEGTLNATTYFATDQISNGVAASVAADLFAGGLISQEEYVLLANYYSGMTFDQEKDVAVETDLPLPMKVGFGIAYTGFDKLLLTADVDYAQWSAWEVIELFGTEGDQAGEKVNELVQNWEDCIRAGAGFEYSVSDDIKVRGGYYTEPGASTLHVASPSMPDLGRRHVGVVGLQFPLGPVSLHANFEHIFIGDTEMNFQEWNLKADQTGYENLPGIYKMSVNNFMVGLDYAL